MYFYIYDCNFLKGSGQMRSIHEEIFPESHSYSRERWISNSSPWISSEAYWCFCFSTMPLYTGITGPLGPHQLQDSGKATFASEQSSLGTYPGVLDVISIYTALSLTTFKKQKQCFWLGGLKISWRQNQVGGPLNSLGETVIFTLRSSQFQCMGIWNCVWHFFFSVTTKFHEFPVTE